MTPVVAEISHFLYCRKFHAKSTADFLGLCFIGNATFCPVVACVVYYSLQGLLV